MDSFLEFKDAEATLAQLAEQLAEEKIPVQHVTNGVAKVLGPKGAVRFLGHLKPGTEKHTSWNNVNNALMKQGVKTHHIAKIATHIKPAQFKEESELGEEKDIVVRDKSGKVIRWSHEGDWSKSKSASGTTTDKSGAKHTPYSKARDLARSALKKTLAKEEVELDEAYGVNLGSRPVSGQKEYQGKEIKSFHPNKEKEAREYAKKHGYVVKKKELPKGSSNITHTWDIHKEETELEEGTFVYHMNKAIAAHERGDAKKKQMHLDNAKTARYAMKSTDIAKHKDLLDKYSQMREEVEQIEELNKSTLASYAKKSAAELPKHQANSTLKHTGPIANAHAGKHPKTGESPIQWDDRKVKNRGAGIARAVDKLAKEATEQFDESAEHYNSGYSASKSGKSRQTNPYKEGSLAAKYWAMGYDHHKTGKQPEKFTEEAELQEAGAYQKDMDEKKPVYAQGVKGMKSKPFTKKFKSMDHYNKWADSEHAGDHEVHRVYQESSDVCNVCGQTPCNCTHINEAGQAGDPLGHLTPAERAKELARRKAKIASNTTPANKKFVDNAIKNVKPRNEETETSGVHRVGVTVSDPNHQAVTQRKEKVQKFVRIKGGSHEEAVERAKKHFKGKGWKVHDAEHAGMVHEEVQIDELSNELLQRYKDKAKVSADALAAKGQHSKANDRWINHMKASGKQIDRTVGNIRKALNKEEADLDEAVSHDSKARYEYANGHKPKGHGQWMFSTVHPREHDVEKHKDQTHAVSGNFSDAAKAAAKHFKDKGHKGDIHVLS